MAPNGTHGWPGMVLGVCCDNPGTIGKGMGMSDRGRYIGGGGNTGRVGSGTTGGAGGAPSIDVRENWATSWFMMDAWPRSLRNR